MIVKISNYLIINHVKFIKKDTLYVFNNQLLWHKYYKYIII